MGYLRGAREHESMFTNRRTVRIEWGDCDPAGIVFYPRYFAMFDHSTVLLIERALGMTKHRLYEAYDFDGYPVVETRARFLIPTALRRRRGDRNDDSPKSPVELPASQHRLSKDGALAVEGFETRVWVVRDPNRPGRPQGRSRCRTTWSRASGAATAPA